SLPRRSENFMRRTGLYARQSTSVLAQTDFRIRHRTLLCWACGGATSPGLRVLDFSCLVLGGNSMSRERRSLSDFVEHSTKTSAHRKTANSATVGGSEDFGWLTSRERLWSIVIR